MCHNRFAADLLSYYREYRDINIYVRHYKIITLKSGQVIFPVKEKKKKWRYRLKLYRNRRVMDVKVMGVALASFQVHSLPSVIPLTPLRQSCRISWANPMAWPKVIVKKLYCIMVMANRCESDWTHLLSTWLLTSLDLIKSPFSSILYTYIHVHKTFSFELKEKETAYIVHY